MKIQSLSIVVPNDSCVNKCAFCVSRQHCNRFPNLISADLPQFDLHMKDYIKRLEFARDNGCNTLMLTGSSEPQQNRQFLVLFGMFLQMMRNPFQWIEMQTTGVFLDRDYLRFLRNHVGVNVISISLSSFDDNKNADVIGMPNGHEVHLKELCAMIKEMGFILRLSVNLTTEIGLTSNIFQKAVELGADQVTIREMYEDGGNSPESRWVKEHRVSAEPIVGAIKQIGKKLGVLPYGAEKYSFLGVTTVVDADCMGKTEQEDESYKYLILQPNCKLYSQWDDPASIIF